MEHTILLPEPIARAGCAYLEERGYRLRTCAPDEDLARAVRGCSGIISRNRPLNAAVFDAEPSLRVIALHGVGCDHIDVPAARARGIALTWTPEANANAVAEHALALLLACARQIPQANLASGAPFSARYQLSGTELSGRTLGIVGFGRTGRLLAQKAALGLSMRVRVFSRHLDDLPPYVTPCSSLDELLPQCDALSLHLPLTEKTRGILDAQRLALLPRGAILVNTARGALCDEAAVCAALQSGQLLAAGIDVFCEEPPLHSPLLTAPNAILTPHIAAATAQAQAAMSLGAAQGIHEALSGLPLTWPLPE